MSYISQFGQNKKEILPKCFGQYLSGIFEMTLGTEIHTFRAGGLLLYLLI